MTDLTSPTKPGLPPTSEYTVVRGTAFHTPAPGAVDVLPRHLFCVAADGTIAAILPPNHPDYGAVLAQSRARGRCTELPDTHYLLPGFVDVHVHAPQWPQSGKALDLPVMQWLDNHTLPLEARFADAAFADRVYHDVVRTTLANGTTTAMYFATVHKETSLLLAQICLQAGQRALVGKVVLDNALCPSDYKDASPAQALADTEWLLHAVAQLPGNTARVWPVITPRFIPTCSDAVLAALGDLAQRSGAHVQTHCAESDWVHQHVNARMGKTDARALADFGLLTPRTLLAHATFLDDADKALIRAHDSALAHCPVSNVFFANSVLPVAEHLRAGTHLGLGTDIAGGYSPSMFDAIRQAVMSARMLEDGVNPDLAPGKRGRPRSAIDFRQAFWLATAGGAQALGLPVGRFEVGRQWDAQAINIAAPGSNISPYAEFDDDLGVLQKILMLAQRCNIATVWVAGQVVHRRNH